MNVENRFTSFGLLGSAAAGLALAAAALSDPAFAAPHKTAKAKASRETYSSLEPERVEAYDPVPSDQVGGIAKRLKLVEILIRKHGRAYDYRINTARQLEATLARLDAAANAAAPATAPAVASPAVETAPVVPPTPTEADETGEQLEKSLLDI